jgi:ABC-type ATPase with predicted acetyltransferase domain
VSRVDLDSPFKRVRLTDGTTLTVSHWSCVGEHDQVLRRNGKYFVKCINGEAQFSPTYNQNHRLRIGNRNFLTHVKEIMSADEYDAYDYLQSFHYRGNGGYGRKAILVIVPRVALLPRVLGYVRLSSSFIVNKPRDAALNGKFRTETIGWDKWDYRSRMKYVNCVVRIARVVVHPEFRGLGLGKALVLHALEFARRHWQIARVKPLFGEMTADMLKYIPFAEHAGMIFVGYTEGNLKRVKKDLRYMIEGRNLTTTRKIRRAAHDHDQGIPGIPDMQAVYASKTLKILEGKNLNLEAFLGKFNFAKNRSIAPRLYSLIHSVIRFPKPTLVIGLTRPAEAFLNSQVEKLAPAASSVSGANELEIERISQPIRFQRVSVSFSASVPKTQRSCAIQEAFGISPTQLETSVFKNLNMEIAAGEILLVSGCSGSGKTVLLDLITRRIRPSNYPTGHILLPPNARIGLFRPIRDAKPLIECKAVFGKDVSRAIYVLNKAGLSEAFLYLRKYGELSEGQKYRAMIARLLNSRSNIWLADDFLSTLDPITANIVAHNVREFSKSSGVAVIAAAPHYETFIHALKPDKVLLKSYGWKWDLYNGTEFLSTLNKP